MDKDILRSAAEITRNRDMDSLECSLVATIAELLSATAVSIFKLLQEHAKDVFEEMVSLVINEDADGNRHCVWDALSNCLVVERHVAECIEYGRPVTYQVGHACYRLLIPIHNDQHLLGVIRIDSVRPLDAHQSAIEGLIRIYENYLAILNESERDKLTGLLNRRTFEKKLERLLRSQKNHQDMYISQGRGDERRHAGAECSAWLAMIDIDHFKRINDNFGHLFGDEVLLRLSQLMRKNFRATDLLFRFGGEEFVVVLEPIASEFAWRVLQRFRNTVAAFQFPQLGHITVSIGYEKISLRDFPETVLESADQALYYAKESGRNRVCNYSQLIAEGVLKKQAVNSDVDLF